MLYIMIILLVIIAVELWIIIYYLHYSFINYTEEKFKTLDERLVEMKKIQYFILHCKSPEELKRIRKREEKYNSKGFSGIDDREINGKTEVEKKGKK